MISSGRVIAAPGRAPKLTDAELITLAVAQVLLAVPNDRQFLALAGHRFGHLFPVLIDQSGYNRRLRRLAPEIGRAISYLAYVSPSFCDHIRLLDSTPVPCGQSRRPRAARSSPAAPATATAAATRAGSGAFGCS